MKNVQKIIRSQDCVVHRLKRSLETCNPIICQRQFGNRLTLNDFLLVVWPYQPLRVDAGRCFVISACDVIGGRVNRCDFLKTETADFSFDLERGNKMYSFLSQGEVIIRYDLKTLVRGFFFSLIYLFTKSSQVLLVWFPTRWLSATCRYARTERCGVACRGLLPRKKTPPLHLSVALSFLYKMFWEGRARCQLQLGEYRLHRYHIASCV